MHFLGQYFKGQVLKNFITVSTFSKFQVPVQLTMRKKLQQVLHKLFKPKRICIKFALCKYVANMKFAKLGNQSKGGNGRNCTKTGKFGHCHLCTGCKALQISYLQHICTRQIWGKFDFSSSGGKSKVSRLFIRDQWYSDACKISTPSKVAYLVYSHCE